MQKVRTKLGSKLASQMGVSEPVKEAPNLDNPKQTHSAHLVHYFQEIGWVDPIRDGPKTVCPEDKNLISGDFNVLAYDESKYVEDAPPYTVYVPSVAMLKKMARTCVKGVNGQPVKKLEDMMGHYTDLEWFEQEKERKRQAQLAAQAKEEERLRLERGEEDQQAEEQAAELLKNLNEDLSGTTTPKAEKAKGKAGRKNTKRGTSQKQGSKKNVKS